MDIWNKRMLRIWSVLLLPIAIFCSYKTYDSHLQISSSSDAIKKWTAEYYRKSDLIEGGKDGPQGIFTLEGLVEYISELRDRKHESIKNRTIYFIASVLLMTSPILWWLAIKIGSWIWYGKK